MMAICPAGPPKEIHPSLTQQRTASPEVTWRGARCPVELCPGSARIALQRLGGEAVKASADAVDVDEGEGPGVRGVGEQDEDAPAARVNPAARAGEAEVAEAVGREVWAG